MRLVQWNSTSAGTAAPSSDSGSLPVAHPIALVRVAAPTGQDVAPPGELLAAATALRESKRLARRGPLKLRFLDAACPGPGVEELRGSRLALVLFGIESLESAPTRGHLDAMIAAAAGFEPGSHGASTPIRMGWIHDDEDAAARLLGSGSFDLVLRGEADEMLPRVVDAALGGSSAELHDWSGFRGMSWTSPLGAVRHEKVGSAPLTLRAPAWDLVDLSRYHTATGPHWSTRLGWRRVQSGAEHLREQVSGTRLQSLLVPVLSKVAGLTGTAGPEVSESSDSEATRRHHRRIFPGRVTLRTCRECPPDCPTCHGSFGSHGRAIATSEVIAEIRDLVTKRRVRRLSIADHAFDGDPARALKIALAVAKLRSAPGCGNLSMTFPRGLRGDGLTPPLIDALIRAGVSTFPLRVTTAAPRLQRLLKENIDLGRVTAALDEIARRGARGHLMLRLALPTETTGEVAHTIRWARQSAAATAEFRSGRDVDLGPAWTRNEAGELDDFRALRRRALTAFYSSPARAGRLAYGAPRSLLQGLQARL